MRFEDCTKRDRALIVFGAACVVVGCILLLGAYTTWVATLLVWFRRLSRIAVPVCLIGIGIYVVWCTKNNRLDAIVAQGANRANPLSRSQSNARIAGVCGGIAQYFGVESVLVRTVAVLLAVASPLFTLIVYAVLVFALPRN